MDPSNAQMRPYSAACDEPNRPPSATPVQKPPVGDVKPRLTKDQHDLLEQHFLTQHKPTTSVKKAFAEKLNVPLDKINVSDLFRTPHLKHQTNQKGRIGFKTAGPKSSRTARR
jgi:hypothetical protein